MKTKVKIITYCHWKSIGSILQSYAISKTLKDCGYENEVWLEEWNRTLWSFPRTLKELLKRLCRMLWSRKIKIAYQKRMSFISEHINVEYFPQYEAFRHRACKNQGDVYLAGSDQIWNPDRCSPLYFLDFASGNRRVSYAASMGKTEISSDKEEYIGNMLQKFDYISVREKECVKVLQRITDQKISVHVDPTFLIDTETWRALEKPRKERAPYILIYMLYWEKACKDQIIALKKRTGLPVYAICPDVSRVFADKYLYDVGVEEFLWLVDHAEYVVTSSFHGVAFSILFRKKFAAVINPKMPSRIKNALDVLSIPLVSIDELDRTNNFTYDGLALNIEKERQRSIKYLEEAIG